MIAPFNRSKIVSEIKIKKTYNGTKNMFSRRLFFKYENLLTLHDVNIGPRVLFHIDLVEV